MYINIGYYYVRYKKKLSIKEYALGKTHGGQ